MNEKDNMVGKVLNIAYKERVPMCCTLEITKKCNFDCIHCYLKYDHETEVSLDDAKAIISQIKENGALFLNLTGGEVFVHSHFCEIYRYAYESGFIITLLTNGSALNEKIRELLIEMPPRKIEITLYGYEDVTLKNVTQREIRSQKILDNVLKLKEDGHNILLKTIAIKENVDDFEKIKTFAQKNGIRFQYDFNILPTLLGNKEVQCHELSIDDTIKLELMDGKLNQWKEMVKYFDYTDNKRLNCGCGKYSYTISSDLLVKKCNFIVDNNDLLNLRKNSFQKIWEMWKKEEKPMFEYNKCKKCEYQAVCDICPSISYSCNRDGDGVVERQCELARRRYNLVNGDCKDESCYN